MIINYQVEKKYSLNISPTNYHLFRDPYMKIWEFLRGTDTISHIRLGWVYGVNRGFSSLFADSN
jgi:hypothetical protein